MSLPLMPYFNPRIESRSRKLMGEFESCLSDPWYVLPFVEVMKGTSRSSPGRTQSASATSTASANTRRRRSPAGRLKCSSTNMTIWREKRWPICVHRRE